MLSLSQDLPLMTVLAIFSVNHSIKLVALLDLNQTQTCKPLLVQSQHNTMMNATRESRCRPWLDFEYSPGCLSLQRSGNSWDLNQLAIITKKGNINGKWIKGLDMTKSSRESRVDHSMWIIIWRKVINSDTNPSATSFWPCRESCHEAFKHSCQERVYLRRHCVSLHIPSGSHHKLR